MENDDRNDIFNKAANHAKTLKNITEDEMLQLYGLYKQALIGPCNISKPPFWDFTGKSKWRSWKELFDMTCDDAKQNYILLVEKLDNSWDRNAETLESNRNASNTFGVSVSRMVSTEDDLLDSEKTILDWCKDGNLDKIKGLISDDKCLLNYVDENRMGVLHWSVDRGHKDIVEYLVEDCGSDINIVDIDGQTPLHYAASCEHLDLVKFLLSAGADKRKKDNNGVSVVDAADNREIKELIMAM